MTFILQDEGHLIAENKTNTKTWGTYHVVVVLIIEQNNRRSLQETGKRWSKQYSKRTGVGGGRMAGGGGPWTAAAADADSVGFTKDSCYTQNVNNRQTGKQHVHEEVIPLPRPPSRVTVSVNSTCELISIYK